ncbi:MAG: NirD/YgiW/YdeI family stress tolerance protein [Deltaproteobacteria bacterium]|jgi:uncharacterized protein (TIGR00156 family)|nr:NirD/YgiW/YdeI family stress tolerance protein [Deltaproteobacteria bacterium]
MKIYLLIAVVLVIAVSFMIQAICPVVALAQGGGFTGPGPQDSVEPFTELGTIDSALAGAHRYDVTLVGNIVKHLGNDEYLFRDRTGEIVSIIHGDIWEGRNITPITNVWLTGKIKRHKRKIVFEVRSMPFPGRDIGPLPPFNKKK